MAAEPTEDRDGQESAARLVDLIRELEPGRPALVEAVERCVASLVVAEKRQRIIERLQRMSPEDVATVEALTAHLDSQR